MSDSADHRRGILIALGGVLTLSPDGLLIRLISADDWTLLFWRGLLMSISLVTAFLFIYQKNIWAIFQKMGKKGVLAAIIQAAGTTFFVLAITHTTVANTLIILGVMPLWAALFSRLFLGEKIHLRTWVAIPVALLGIYITTSTQVQTCTGDLYAICSAIFLALHGVVARSAKNINMTPSLAIGGLFIALIALVNASPLSVTPTDATYLALLGFFILPVSFGLLITAPRYIPAPEVNLILLLEMVLGTYWVWLFIGEEPTSQALIGGSLIIITLAIHTYLGFRTHKKT